MHIETTIWTYLNHFEPFQRGATWRWSSKSPVALLWGVPTCLDASLRLWLSSSSADISRLEISCPKAERVPYMAAGSTSSVLHCSIARWQVVTGDVMITAQLQFQYVSQVWTVLIFKYIWRILMTSGYLRYQRKENRGPSAAKGWLARVQNLPRTTPRVAIFARAKPKATDLQRTCGQVCGVKCL